MLTETMRALMIIRMTKAPSLSNIAATAHGSASAGTRLTRVAYSGSVPIGGRS